MLRTQNFFTENTHTNKYSNFFILVCNVPGIEYTNNHQKKIIANLQESWKIKNNDPNLERMHIIFLHPNDPSKAYGEKFRVLNRVDTHSKIYIIGHCHPGSDHISSDPYLDKNKNKAKFAYSYVDIAGILLANIQNPNVIFVRSQEEESLNKINRPARKLRICIPSCNSSVDGIDESGNIKHSFAKKLFEFITSKTMYLINCDLTGSNGYLYPVASEPHISSIIKLFIQTEAEPGFHKRYFWISGNYATVFPRHKPGNNYKTTFVLAPNLSIDNFDHGVVSFLTLSVRENNDLYQLQTRFEKLLSRCMHILDDNSYRSIQQKITPMYQRLLSGKIYSEKHIQGCEQAIDFLLNKSQNDLEKNFQPNYIRS